MRTLSAPLLACLLTAAAAAAPGAATLKKGAEGPDVVLAQHYLHQLGLLPAVPDGMFGSVTLEAVRQFQTERGLVVDGVVGARTWTELEKAVAAQTTRIYTVQPNDTLWDIARQHETTVEALAKVNGINNPSLIFAGRELVVPAAGSGLRSLPAGGVELVHWNEAQAIYSNFKVITVTDVKTGKTFQARRYFGHHHADTEPLTAKDTAILREIYGGEWSWDRRPVIVEVDGRRIAASINGVPHGQGSIADNGFPGHFCIHFLGSRIHRTGMMDIRHQTAVLEAAGYAVADLWLARR